MRNMDRTSNCLLIKEIRTSKKLTIADMSERTGIAPSYFSLIERGIRNPTVSILGRIAEALEVESIRELFK